MSAAGAASIRAALADLPAPRFVSLRNRHLWGAATRRADEALREKPARVNARDLDVLAEAHSFTREGRYLVGAVERVLDHGAADDTASAAYRIGYLVRAAGCDAAISDDDVGQLLALAHESAANPGGSLDGICARLALASYLEGVIEAGSRREAEDDLLTVLESRLDPEGVHLSGSPGHHAAVLGRLAAVLDGGLTEAAALIRLRLRMEEVMSWMVAPDGTLVEIGETRPMVIGGVWTGTATPGRMKSVYRHPALLHAATAGALGVAPARGWRVLPHAGLAFLKQGWPDAIDRRSETSYVVFSGSNGGGQADALSLVWFHRGRWLLVDAGHPGEGGETARPDQKIASSWTRKRRKPDREAMAAFACTPAAHNTVAIGGGPAGDRQGGFLRWGEIGHVPFVDARVSLGSADHRRSIAVGPDWLLIVDRVDSGRAEQATVWFHSPGDLDVSMSDAHHMVVEDGAPVAWVTPLGTGGEGIAPVGGSLHDPIQGWRVGPTGRPTPAWAYGWRHTLPIATATLFTTAGPAGVVTVGPQEYVWEAAGSRVRVGIDDIGITSIQEEPI